MILKKIVIKLNNKIYCALIFWALFEKEWVFCQEEEQQGTVIVNLIYGIGIPWDVQGGYMTTGYVVRVPYAFPMKIKEWKSPFAKYFQKRAGGNETISFPKKRRRKKLRKKREAKLFPKEQPRFKASDYNADHFRWAVYKAMEIYSKRPSSSVEPLAKHSDNEYHYAERVGRLGAPCGRIFKECKRSLLDTFSLIHSKNRALFM